MLDVVILTDERFANASGSGEVYTNAMLEDQMVMTELIKHGLAVKKVAWSDPDFDWQSTKYAMFRTTWDYAERFEEFADWLMDVSIKTRLINSYDLVSWNLDKHYLNDLKNAGVNIVESYFIQPNDNRSLREVYTHCGWDTVILKPCISASAKDTYMLTDDDIANHESIYRDLIEAEAMMLQPFQTSVLEKGELSLMLINGEYTHAVVKNAQDGDFRVQDDFGGTVEEHQPTEEEIQLAVDTVRACDEMPIYARVDIITDNNGNPAISELEIVEPEMWYRLHTEAAEKLGLAVAQLFK